MQTKTNKSTTNAVYFNNACSAHKLQYFVSEDYPLQAVYHLLPRLRLAASFINYNYEKYAVYNLYKSGCVVILSDYLFFSHWRFRTFSVVLLSFQNVTPKRFGYLMLLSTMCAATEMTRLLLYPEHCNILISLINDCCFQCLSKE